MGKKTVCDTLAKTYGYKVIPKYTTKTIAQENRTVAKYSDGTTRFKEDANLICLEGDAKIKLEEHLKRYYEASRANSAKRNDEFYFYERKKPFGAPSTKEDSIANPVLYCIKVSELEDVAKSQNVNYILVCSDIGTIKEITKSIGDVVITVLVIGSSRPDDLKKLRDAHAMKLSSEATTHKSSEGIIDIINATTPFTKEQKDKIASKLEGLDTWTWDEVVRVITDVFQEVSLFDYAIINGHISSADQKEIASNIIFQWDRFHFPKEKKYLLKHKTKNGAVVFIRPFNPEPTGDNRKYKIKRIDGKRESYSLPDFVSTWMDDYFTKQGFKFTVASLENHDNVLVVEKIIDDIKGADIVLCDLTYNRNNCYWELGYAEGLGKPVILVVEEHSKKEIPFDKKGFTRFVFSVKKNEDGDYDINFTDSHLFYDEVNIHKQQLDVMEDGKNEYKKRFDWENNGE
jgi:nucleoside 2-deoxyribosyltransferase